MHSIPLLEDEDDDIRQSLSLEEIRIALSFLKKRFRDYSVKEIVQSLNEYLSHKEPFAYSVAYRSSNPVIQRVRQAPFMHHRSRPSVYDDRSDKCQQIRLIAKLYCESGINLSLAQFFYPQTSLKQYKGYLQMITVQTLNNIQKFLRYECNVQIEQLSKLQKRSARQKLIYVRDWMGKTFPQHLKTYFAFIERYYLNEGIQIQYKQTFQLYKVILESVKGPDVLINQPNQPRNRSLREELVLNDSQKDKKCTKEEENALILLFKQVASIQKVSDLMSQKYGYQMKWTKHSVKYILKRILKSSLKKLSQTAKKYQNSTPLRFGYGDEDVNILFEYENALPTKIQLLDFYMQKKISLLKLKQHIRKINNFYSAQLGYEQLQEDQIPQQPVQIPKLVSSRNKRKQLTTIQIQDQAKQQVIRPRNNVKFKNSQRKKKKNWHQVIELDQEVENQALIQVQVQNKEQWIQPSQKDSQSKFDQQTNVDAMIPINKRQQQIFKKTPKQDKKKPETIIEEKPKRIQINRINQQNSIIKKNEKHIKISRKQEQKRQKVNQGTNISLKDLIRNKLNQSLDSVGSAPQRLTFNQNIIKSKQINKRISKREQLDMQLEIQI